MTRIPFGELWAAMHRVLLYTGFTEKRAFLVARLFAENQRDGVYSHELNRFPGLVDSIRSEGVDIHVTPEKVDSLGVVERWDGKMGVVFGMLICAWLARSQSPSNRG